MKVKIISAVGEALNFGARRMETIMRVAWLPVVLLLVLNMGAAFMAISIASNRVITFKHAIASNASYDQVANQAIGQILAALQAFSTPMWAFVMAMLVVNLILISSFMVPLIRYAGLGEKPAPGTIRIPFGADQIRFLVAGFLSFLLLAIFICAPIGVASYSIVDHVSEALSASYASFPDPNSLHTIELVRGEEKLTADGAIWKFLYGYWIAAAAGFGALLWLLLTMHFHPKNRGTDPATANAALRSLVVFFALVAGLGASFLFLRSILTSEAVPTEYGLLFFALVVGCLFFYASLRIFPYLGVAVCRRSLASAGTLRLTRGWNLFRLAAVLVAVFLLTAVVEWVVTNHVFGWLFSALTTLFQATVTYTNLTGSGEQAGWVFPLFAWIWASLKILYTIFWTFFTYGVTAGLLGRLYRDSEKQSECLVKSDGIEAKSDIWALKN